MKKCKNQKQSIEDAIIELYLNVKVRKQEEIENYNEDFLEKEKEKLRKTSPFVIIGYIKSSIEILIDLKVQEKLQEIEGKKDDFVENFEFGDGVNEYEKLLRKLEANIRSYVKVEHQLKLHAEGLQNKIEEIEKQKEELKQKNKIFQEQSFRLKSKDLQCAYKEEHQQLKNEIAQLQKVVKTYEEHNLKIPELEKVVRQQKTNFEKEKQKLESFYKDKIKSYQKRLEHYDILNSYKSESSSRHFDDDLDRVNYNHKQIKTAIRYDRSKSSSHSPDVSKVNNKSRSQSPDVVKRTSKSRSHSPDVSKINTNKKSPSLTVERNDSKLANDKFEKTKKPEKKILNEMNIKTVFEDFKYKKETPYVINQTLIDTNQTLESSKVKINPDLSEIVNYPGTQRKKDSTVFNFNTKNLDSAKNSHKMSSLEKETRIPSNNVKTIHHLKDVTKQQETKATKIIENNYLSNVSNNNSKISSVPANSNIILNQNGIPCYNNIHIYTSGINGVKNAEINLRHFVLNKVNLTKKLLKNNNNITKEANQPNLNNLSKTLARGKSNTSMGQ